MWKDVHFSSNLTSSFDDLDKTVLAALIIGVLWPTTFHISFAMSELVSVFLLSFFTFPERQKTRQSLLWWPKILPANSYQKLHGPTHTSTLVSDRLSFNVRLTALASTVRLQFGSAASGGAKEATYLQRTSLFSYNTLEKHGLCQHERMVNYNIYHNDYIDTTFFFMHVNTFSW